MSKTKIRKSGKSPRPRRKKTSPVRFGFDAPWASDVHLAGTFNGWSTSETPLNNSGDGKWHVSLDLAPGHYEYKFFVDGRWCCKPGCCDGPDALCPECVPHAFGTMNRVIEVG